MVPVDILKAKLKNENLEVFRILSSWTAIIVGVFHRTLLLLGQNILVPILSRYLQGKIN